MAQILNKFSKKKKWQVFFLLIFSIGIFGGGFVYLRYNIQKPYDYFSGETMDINEVFNQQLMNQDMDGDGLTDNEELNVYFTSPYLFDSDSDGISDLEEINAGKDPNCAEGAVCSQEQTGEEETVEEVQDENLNISQVDLLRQSLVEDGMPQEEADALSDEDIMAMFKEAGVVSEPAADSGESSLSADELRLMLIKEGLSEDVLDQYSDEELVKMYSEIMEKEGGN